MSYEIKEFYDAEQFYEYRKLFSYLYRTTLRDLQDPERFQAVWSSQPTAPELIRLGAFDQGRLYAAAQLHRHKVHYDGKELLMYGVGGVLSEYSKPYKGAMQQVFAEAFLRMKEQGTCISHLFPFSDDYYRQYGYEISSEKAIWEVPVSAIKKMGDGRFVIFDNSDKMKQEIRDIYNCFAARQNMAVLRTDRDWDEFFEAHTAFAGNCYTFVSYTDAGADGFVSFSRQKEGDQRPNYHADAICFKTYAGLRGLLAYFSTQTSYVENVILELPADIDLFPLLDSRKGNGMRHTHRFVRNIGLSRVVCVEGILKAARYHGQGQATIRIAGDTYCPWNNDCFTVTFGGETTVTRGGEPDIEMDIGAFTAGILGRCDPYALTAFPSVKIFGNEETLQKVFYRKPCWIGDKF